MASTLSLLLFFLVLLSPLFFLVLQPPFLLSAAQHRGGYINTIYSLGDAISDTGSLPYPSRAGVFASIGHSPYGETFFKKLAGSSSDGLLLLDYLVPGIKLSFVNPYPSRDVNFAVAGSTALNNSFFLERGITMPYNNISLNVQLDWFKNHLKSTCFLQADCAKRLEGALFLVGEIGGNDYNYAFFQGKSVVEVMTYVPHVVDNIINTAKEVIHAGAVHIIVPGIFPIGCIRSYRYVGAFTNINPEAYDENGCLKDLNEFAMFHNKHLQKALEGLRQEYPHVSMMYVDYYRSFMSLLDKVGILGHKSPNNPNRSRIELIFGLVVVLSCNCFWLVLSFFFPRIPGYHSFVAIQQQQASDMGTWHE